MELHRILLTAIVAFLHWPALGEQFPIIIDGLFDDWEGVPTAYEDSADEGGSGIDFRRLWIADDDRFLFLRVEFGDEIDASENNQVRLYLDTDADAMTGLPVGGIGAELEWRLGERTGVFRLPNQPDSQIAYLNIDFRGAPTIDSTDFEFAVGRDAIPDAVNSFFQVSMVRVHIEDGAGADTLPDNGDTVSYTFDQGSLPPETLVLLERDRETDLRVISYNVFRDSLFDPSLRPAFERQITAVAPDILNFQEIITNSLQATVDLVAEVLPLSEGETWFGARNADVITVSRFPITGAWPLFGVSAQGGNLALLIDTESTIGTPLLIINVHPPSGSNDTGRQFEIDEIMAFIRDAQNPGGGLDLERNTPMVITGDMNFVGRSQQLTSLLTGDIVNEVSFGADFPPDWDGSAFTDLISRHTDQRMGYTWRSDSDANFWPGHLDYFIYSDSVLSAASHFILYTPAMSAGRLSDYGLRSSDSLVSDHFLIAADFRAAKADLVVAGVAELVDNGTSFMGNIYNGFELSGQSATFSSIAGEITRISFLDPGGDLVFAEFGSDDPDTTLTIVLEGFRGSQPSPYDQPTTTYVQGLSSFMIENATAGSFLSLYTLGNDPTRIDLALIRDDTFSDGVDGIADIRSITVNAADGRGGSIGGINAADANFVADSGVIGIEAEDIAVQSFLFVEDMMPSGSAQPRLSISGDSPLMEVLITGGDLAEATGDFQIDTNGVVYPFDITATSGQRSISDSTLRPDLGDGSLAPVTDTFAADPDAYFVTDGQRVGVEE